MTSQRTSSGRVDADPRAQLAVLDTDRSIAPGLRLLRLAGGALALLALLIAGTLLVPNPTANAQLPTPTPTPGTTVSVVPSAQTVSAGSDVVVQVRVSNVTGLAAYEFELQYDQSVLEYSSVLNGTFLGSTGRSVTCLTPQLSTGKVRFGCVTFGTSPPSPSGSGLLATLTFHTSCGGTSPLDFTLAGLGNALGAGIPTQTQDGSASVTGGGACPTPTVTPTPGPATPTPSPSPTATATSTGPSPTPVPQLCSTTPGATFCVLPVSQPAFTGQQVTLQVALDNAANVGAYQFDLVFDSQLLSAVSVTNSTYLGSTGRSVVCLPSLLADRITFACSTLGTTPPGPSGSGILATVKLQANAVGLSNLTLENAVLAQISSAEIPIVSLQPASVTISPPPTATDTRTPTNTFTPTNTATVNSPTPPSTPTPGAGPETVVRIDPDTQLVVQGADVLADVVIESVTNMGAYSFTLDYDPELLSFIQITNSSFLGSGGGSVVCVGPDVNEVVGRLEFGCFNTSATGVTGSGTIATVRLGTSCFGSSELTLSDASVANAVGAPNATSPHNASVGVVGGTSCSLQPSATEEPTNTSTPTPSGATMLVHVAPANQGVLQGTDVLVDVAIDDVPDLGSYTFTIDYEPTLLSFVSTTNGSFLESNGGSAFCVGPVVNSVAGTAQFGCTLVGASGPTGSGILATVRFGSFCGGSGPLNLPQVGIADSLGQPISSGTQGASVTVIGSTTCPTPLPTATSTPTNTPTSPAPTPTTNVFFNPSSQGVSQGTDVIVDLEIQNVTDFGAYEFTLDYDPTLLAFASATNGPYLGSTGGVVNCVGPTVNSSTGRVTLGCVQTGAAGAIGDGVMATVTFHTSCQGADTLSLTSLDVSDSLGQPILSGSHTAAITVLGSTTCPTPVPATNTPTATPTGPTPTATGTPTPPPCGGTAAFKLCLQPASQTAEQGSNKTYQVTVANAPALGAFQVSLTWDPGIASLVSITPGSFLASTGRLVTCLAPISEPGAVHYVCVSLEPTPAGPTGSGVLANLTLKGQALGTTTLSLQDVILTNVGGVAYAPPTLQSGSLTVVAANTPTPTLSPTNTLTPTETLTPTPTLSPTPCPGVCPTATDTRTPTNTFTPTNTRTPTNTPTATPTPISGPVTMRIQPVSQSVQVGSGVTVEIVADNVTNLGAFQFHLDFGEGVTSVGSVQVGPFLGSTGRSVTCLPPTLGSGFLDYACATIGSSVPGPSGSGVIARINYVTFVEGLSIQHLSNAILTDITSSKLLPLITQDGVVAVVTPATATPPPTSTLTATATPGSPSFAAQLVLPAGMSGEAATLFVGEPGVRGNAAGSLVIPGASIAKYPAESNLFLGDQPKVIYERAFNVPAGAGVGGFELEIAFNHKLVSVDVDGQPFIDTLVGTNRSATCIKDFAEGVVRLGCVTTGTDPGPTGTFDLARIHVTPDSGLPIRPAAGNGIEVVLDDVTLNTQISNTLGSPYPLTSVGDAKVIIRALEADVNLDCSVNVADEQIIARRFGATKGSTLYETWYDLDPQTFADGDIDINDLQAIYGRHGSTCDNPWTAQEPPTKTTPTPTVTATITPTPSPPSTTPTATPGDTTPTATSTVTPTSTPGTSQEVTPTASPGPTPTSTPGGGSSGTPEPSVTPTATSAATATNTPAGSATPQPTPSATATDVADAGTTPTDTPTPITPTATLEPGVTPTNTPEVVPVATNTPPPPSTSTPVPIPTAAPAPTSTSLPAPTNTPITVRPTTVPVGTGPTNTPPSGTGPTATDTGPGGPGFVSSPTNTPVSDIAPSTEQPVSGLPDTGAASSSTEEAVTTSLAVMGFGGSLLLLIGAQLIWARRRRPEPVFKLRFQQVLSSRRTRD